MRTPPVIRPEFASVEARRMEFPGQLPGERVLANLSPAHTLWVGSLPSALAFGLGAWAIFQLLAQTVAPGLRLQDERAIVGGALVFLLVPMWFLLVYRNSRTLITDRRVIYTTLSLPGVEERKAIPFRDIEKLNCREANPIYRLLGIGHVVCEPKRGSIHQPLDIPHVPQARDLVEYLEQVRKLGASVETTPDTPSVMAA